MPALYLVILAVLFFVTSAVGVVTGSNSLITVPVMFQFGIDEKVSIATNMFGLTFMAIGATIPFVRSGTVALKPLAPLMLITTIGSAIGAAMVGLFSGEGIRLAVTIAMFAVVIFILFGKRTHAAPETQVKIDKPVPVISAAGLIATFLLAVYGGFYSGGYVTILTAVFIGLFSMTYSSAIAATKVINVFSSAIATAIFMWQGLVDYKLGAMLAVSMFIGAYAGAHFASRISETALRRVFLSGVVLLAGKTLYDVLS